MWWKYFQERRYLRTERVALLCCDYKHQNFMYHIEKLTLSCKGPILPLPWPLISSSYGLGLERTSEIINSNILPWAGTHFSSEQVAQNLLCTEGLQYKTFVDPHFTGPFVWWVSASPQAQLAFSRLRARLVCLRRGEQGTASCQQHLRHWHSDNYTRLSGSQRP